MARGNPFGAVKLPVRDALIIAQTEREIRRNKREEGELVDANLVESEWIDAFTALRQRLLAISARVAARYPAAREVIAEYDRELRDALQKAADDEL